MDNAGYFKKIWNLLESAEVSAESNNSSKAEKKEESKFKRYIPKTAKELQSLSKNTQWSTKELRFADMYVGDIVVYVNENDKSERYAYDKERKRFFDQHDKVVNKSELPEGLRNLITETATNRKLARKIMESSFTFGRKQK